MYDFLPQRILTRLLPQSRLISDHANFQASKVEITFQINISLGSISGVFIFQDSHFVFKEGGKLEGEKGKL